MNYADNTYYAVTYLSGKEAVIDAAFFDYYARKATKIIKQYTFNRVSDSNIPDDVKMCCCELAEALYSHEKSKDNGNIASEDVGEYSVSYIDREKWEATYRSKVDEIINLWLADTGLLYRGLC